MFSPFVLVLLSIGIVFPIIIRRAQDKKIADLQKSNSTNKNKRKK